MNLQSWFRMMDVDLSDTGLFVTVATDGFKVGRDNVICVSWSRNTRGPYDHLYIDGGDIEKVEKYTGITHSLYAREAVGPDRAVEILDDLLHDVDIVIGFTIERFTRPFLAGFAPMQFSGKTFLDIVSLIKLHDSDEGIPKTIRDVETLAERLNDAVRLKTPAMKGKSYSIDNLTERFGVDSIVENALKKGVARNRAESRIVSLCMLYEVFSTLPA